MTELAAILDQIDSGSILLRVPAWLTLWNLTRSRGLMRSLYKGYPVGGLLTWKTQADGSAVRARPQPTPQVRVPDSRRGSSGSRLVRDLPGTPADVLPGRR